MIAEPVGEIIETSTTEFLAQACELGRAPAFGSLVKADCPPAEVFGLVYRVRTGGIDPGSQAVMRGRSGLRDDAIYRENPDLRAVLRTEFGVLIVGFCEDGELRQYLPPHPPSLHWSVYECQQPDVVTFSEQLDYFRTVLAVTDAPADELLAANLRQVRRARAFDRDFSLKAGRELARLLTHEYDRLSAILRRLER
jgi:HAS barrel domain